MLLPAPFHTGYMLRYATPLFHTLIDCIAADTPLRRTMLAMLRAVCLMFARRLLPRRYFATRR